MKILIVTIVDNINYGTYLQAFATWYLFKQKGCDPIILDYSRSYISPFATSKQYLNDSSKSFVKKIAYSIGYPLLYKYMVWNVKRFLKNNAKLTKKFTSLKNIIQDCIEADVYVTGSDQVWNSDYNGGIDKVYFLGFTNGKKYSFSSSIGINSFPLQNQNLVKEMLSQYRKITVREQLGVSILNDLGIYNVEQIVDPTLLIDRYVWSEKIRKKIFVKKEPYLLIYSVEKEKLDIILTQAKEIAKKRGLKIYWVCPTIKFKRQLGIDKVFSLATIDSFLSLMLYADFVIVSSFHGTAFSINFNKQFLTVSPSKYNSRVMSLLDLFGLQNRYVDSKLVANETIEEIDYTTINLVLEKHRNKANCFLHEIIENQ